MDLEKGGRVTTRERRKPALGGPAVAVRLYHQGSTNSIIHHCLDGLHSALGDPTHTQVNQRVRKQEVKRLQAAHSFAASSSRTADVEGSVTMDSAFAAQDPAIAASSWLDTYGSVRPPPDPQASLPPPTGDDGASAGLSVALPTGASVTAAADEGGLGSHQGSDWSSVAPKPLRRRGLAPRLELDRDAGGGGASAPKHAAKGATPSRFWLPNVFKLLITHLQLLGLLRTIRMDWPSGIDKLMGAMDQTQSLSSWVVMECAFARAGGALRPSVVRALFLLLLPGEWSHERRTCTCAAQRARCSPCFGKLSRLPAQVASAALSARHTLPVRSLGGSAPPRLTNLDPPCSPRLC